MMNNKTKYLYILDRYSLHEISADSFERSILKEDFKIPDYRSFSGDSVTAYKSSTDAK